MKSATRLLNAAHAWASSSGSPTDRMCVTGSNRSGTMSRSSMSTAVAAAGQVSLGAREGVEASPVPPAQTDSRRRENGFVDLAESNSAGAGQDGVAASGGEGVVDTAGTGSLTGTDTALERRGQLGMREGEQALIQKLKHQREELKSLVLPVLPTLSALLVYEDEALVQVRPASFRSLDESTAVSSEIMLVYMSARSYVFGHAYEGSHCGRGWNSEVRLERTSQKKRRKREDTRQQSLAFGCRGRSVPCIAFLRCGVCLHSCALVSHV